MRGNRGNVDTLRKRKDNGRRNMKRIGSAVGALVLALTGLQVGAAEIPRGAILVGVDEYRVPSAVEDDGCQFYTRRSKADPTHRGGYYQKPDGEFTTERSEADCPTTGGPTYSITELAQGEGWVVLDVSTSSYGPSADEGTTYRLVALDADGNVLSSNGFERHEVAQGDRGQIFVYGSVGTAKNLYSGREFGDAEAGKEDPAAVYGWGVRIPKGGERIDRITILDGGANVVHETQWEADGDAGN